MIRNSAFVDGGPRLAVNGLVFSYFAIFFIAPWVANYIATALFVVSLGLLVRPGIALDRNDKWFAMTMVLMPALFLLSMLAHGWALRYLDRPAHLLLAIPLYLAARRVGLNALMPLLGLALGVLAGLPLSMYQRFHLGEERAMGLLSGGDFGNLAGALAAGLAMAAFCLRSTSGAEARWPSPRTIITVLLLASVAGFLISVWSGNRTAWVAYFVILLACLPGLLRNVRRTLLVYVVIAGALLLLFVALPELRARVMVGVHEIQAYLSGQHPEARDTSMGIRLDSLALGTQICSSHPLAGIGILDFKELARTLAAQGAIAAVIPTFFGMLHNQFLDACVLLGIWGVALQLAFWALVFSFQFSLVREWAPPATRAVGFCLLSISIAYFVSATGASMFGSAKGTLFMVVAWGSLAAAASPVAGKLKDE